MKKPWKERVGDFFAGKGFYIVLFLCVAAIGISGYYLFRSLGPGEKDAAVNAPAQVVVTPAPTPAITASPPAVTASPRPSATPGPSAAPAATAPAPSAPPAAPSSAPTQASAVFTWPVKGEVLYDFSLEVLSYDETMRDWRTHSGVDIAASVGTQVTAVSGGTVEQVYQDDLMGTTVMINHGNGLRSIYSNLAASPAVAEGAAVSTGSVIGSVGNTAIAEGARASHLHLEMTLDGLPTDPMRYLP